MRSRRCLAVLAAMLCWRAATARAGNDDELLAGNDAAMMGGAVASSVDDASATWYNPAGLGGIRRSQVDVSGTVYSVRFYSAPEFIRSVGGQSDDASVTEFVAVPTQIAYVRALSPRAALGLGYFVPQATTLVLRERLAIGAGGGSESEWQVAVAQARVLHNGAVGVGWSAAPNVRLGASLIGNYEAETESSILFGAVSNAGATERAVQVAAIGTGGRIGTELALGLQLDLSPRLGAALAVRSPRVQLSRSRDAALSHSIGSGVQSGSPVFDAGTSEDLDAAGGLALLRAGRFGASLVYAYAPGSRVCVEADVQPGLHDRAQDIDRKPVVNARLGIYHRLNAGLAVGGGLFSDRSPDSFRGDAGVGSADFYGVTLGLKLSNEHLLAPSEPAQSLIFKTVFALRYAFARGDMGDLVVDPDDPTLSFGDARGKLIVHELGLFVGSGLEL